VVQDNENDGVFYLYELYTDQAAFMRHLETVHFNAFNTQAKPFVATKALFQGKRLASCLTNQI
jgi:quinol monooxygenase YgiN